MITGDKVVSGFIVVVRFPPSKLVVVATSLVVVVTSLVVVTRGTSVAFDGRRQHSQQ